MISSLDEPEVVSTKLDIHLVSDTNCSTRSVSLPIIRASRQNTHLDRSWAKQEETVMV